MRKMAQASEIIRPLELEWEIFDVQSILSRNSKPILLTRN
jgi:hypothetical protein